jgi:hypothetical protein
MAWAPLVASSAEPMPDNIQLLVENCKTVPQEQKTGPYGAPFFRMDGIV